MRFLQIKDKSETFQYIAESIFEFSKPRGLIVNSYDTENSQFQVESALGFKQYIGSITKIMNCEMIGSNYREDYNRYPLSETKNKLIFLPDGLYSVNFGNLNRKESMIIESMLNVNRVYQFIFSDGEKTLGSVIILYSEEKFPFETMLEIFLHQATIAINRI